MTISTVSFDKAKIYKNKMFFTKNCKNGSSIRVFDNFGENIVNRLSHKPVRFLEGDKAIIMKKYEYEIPNKGIIFQTVKRIYDKLGKLSDIRKEFYKA